MTESQHELLWRVEGAAGIIVLNRPSALNALTLTMVRGMNAALDAFEHDARVTRVIVRGAGDKAFCAGGDIRLLHDQGKAGDHAAQLAFWREEYLLNIRIKTFAKPYIALINGIVMGGGVGVSQHGTYRVASESYMFAMPEVGIGFFPDVGATYFLPRLPHRFGMFLGLTGARVNVGDAVAFGLVDAMVPRVQFDALEQRLSQGGDIAQALAEFSVSVAPERYYPMREQIAELFAADAPLEVLAALARDSSEFAQKQLADLAKKSAFSVCIAAEQVRRGAELSFADAMKIEYRVVSRICRQSDFYEGVRAVLIDKDQAPRWQYGSVAAVPPAGVENMFAPLEIELG